ncbi:MAG: bifunctional UDP-N-acetylglucosamine diphosphorylase/glucosamine-1-phosphate N-acetyltransferase GlmU [Candidatus Rickettsiella isopodorum]|jgi:bifunctional UDP-N-acetylglucosamine pyrophosphorylase/glucosamine-1-phosphate N-acetyltransferase|nr:bifunctional UDP-N-acetylglucosamine diphosphorylase/glucosamine-1-phosphate N-acetyltransferase GlmU [Gammaproteobacteria bacterium]MCH9754658.1 bifunctional UDP-N-acetylglucosamine diphosphorylase/glucosamine-1-phosphate N-acetyltransferase GlmU [Gammaproteobacteria bacterium]MDD5161391.1 bifunctional UDP-N-acetylglucosamine diphosphorylase/glucosamine-1-phosphate N-acetyltransferase GlmU [Candidatus Rickettsiella isopodorum]MDQ5899131.1 bifunctional UDP-N-acetylglucosamine pyrophosphorylas
MKLLDVIILAAGHGKRMHSTLPKVLHKLAGKPLLQYIVETIKGLQPHAVYVVYGNGGGQVPQCLGHLSVNWVKQTELLGTGHAVAQAIPEIKQDESRTLILLGDTPLVSLATLQKLIYTTETHQIGLITLTTQQPFGLGRILRDQEGKVVQIVEEKDASSEQKKIQEVNSGIFYISVKLLKRWLPKIKKMNAQGEYYLTDIITMAVEEKIEIVTVSSDIDGEMQGVNDRVQLAKLERYFQQQAAEKLMLAGVTLRDPQRFDLRGQLTVEKDVIIDVNVILEGENSIGASSSVGSHSILKDVKIGKNVEIKPYSLIEDAIIGDNCIIGPFARIRPGSVLKNNVHIGNFVEVKKSQIEQETKINHLSYIGDANIGKNVNIGAGTITCNYDGAVKNQTQIEDDVFVGSNTALIAPIRIQKGATIGAGSTLNKDVPAGKLTLNRADVKTLSNWKRPRKKET